MKKPVIGIAPSHNIKNDDISLRLTYPRAVQAAIVIPVVLPLETTQEDLRQLVHMCDGFLSSGDPDPRPFLFGEETQARCGNVSIVRDTMEPLLLKAAMVVGKPVLKICRGAQIINVGLGGIIYQDIPSQTERSFPTAHRQPLSYPVPSYYVAALRGPLLAEIAAGQAELTVNSFHHQAAQTPVPGLTVSAYMPDGIIEAVEIWDYPCLSSVQWHPGHMWPKDRAATSTLKGSVKVCR